MHSLDSLDEINKLDTGNILSSIEKLAEQIKQAWYEVKNLEVPAACGLAKNVIISGMGGSALGGRIVDSLIADRARTPIEIFTEYNLPNYVNKDTLVIVSSYSGDTEETLSAANEALSRGAMVFGITTGGKLEKFLKENNLSGYIFSPLENPSNMPRMGVGYSIAAVLAVLAKCEFINLLDSEMEDVIGATTQFVTNCGATKNETNNLAKSLARKLKDKIPVIVASEHLIGSAHSIKNYLNENSKTFALLFDLPELNHHLMEGLRNPAEAKKYLHFLFLESGRYSKRVQLRYPITQEVVGKNEITFDVYKAASNKKILDIFEVLVLGLYLSFYLAMLYEINPTPIPWVDYFKQELSKS